MRSPGFRGALLLALAATPACSDDRAFHADAGASGTHAAGQAGSGVGGSGVGGSGVGGSGVGGSGAGGSGVGGSGVGGSGVGGDGSGGGGESGALATFSFFVTSIQAIATLSGTDVTEPEGFGFGGDLRFGKADGLSGADEICRQAAELGMPGAGRKGWRAFLSTFGPPAVHARDRIGPGPWYDARGRLVAADLAALLDEARPQGDPAVANDLPNERGEPNHYVGPNGYTPSMTWDNHDALTGSDTSGNLTGVGTSDTCEDWTSSEGLPATGPAGPRVGHTWPRTAPIGRGAGWASDHRAPGCALGYSFEDANLPGEGYCVGCAGGYGAIYCFALPNP